MLCAALTPAATAPHRRVSPGPCGAGGLTPLITPGRVLLLGEIHGSREGPPVVAAVACMAAARAQPVLVALELPIQEQDRVDRFLESEGDSDARAALLEGNFWRRAYQDGRSSVAMAQLLEALRRMRSEGESVDVALLDSSRPFSGGQERDDWLARRLVEIVDSAPRAALVVSLTGNVHARTTVGVPWDAAYRPAGVTVAERWPSRTLSLLLANPPGSAWICTGSGADTCGPRPLGGMDGREAGRVELYAAPRDGYDGSVDLAGLTASPPAGDAPGGGGAALRQDPEIRTDSF